MLLAQSIIDFTLKNRYIIGMKFKRVEHKLDHRKVKQHNERILHTYVTASFGGFGVGIATLESII